MYMYMCVYIYIYICIHTYMHTHAHVSDGRDPPFRRPPEMIKKTLERDVEADLIP